MNPKNEKGITLIALVITIIVLLILAVVTINTVLDDEGIISQVEKAKEAQDKASSKELGEINSLNWRISVAAGTHESIASEKDGVPIPKGFEYSEGKKDTGLVIKDSKGKGKGNEFVWIPVDNSTLPIFEKEESGNYKGKFYDWGNWNGKGNPTETTQFQEPSNVGLDNKQIGNLQEEYNKMAQSVEKYGGFYVGRYELAIKLNFEEGKTEYVSQSEYSPVRENNWYEFYKITKELYPDDTKENETGVISGMIYGSQWNAIMKWMKDEPNINDKNQLYIKDSNGMGNFGTTPAQTGKTATSKVKNIFDLAGNFGEMTQCAYVTDIVEARTCFGGHYDGEKGRYNGPVSNYEFKSADDSNNSDIGTRLQLYIK